MFKVKLHFLLLISEYYVRTTKYHARKFHKNNDKLQKWAKRLDQLLLGDS